MTYVPQILLAALSVVGYLGLHYLGNKDGLFPLLEDMSKAEVYPVNFTSLRSVKELGGILLGFFVPAADGSHPALSLASYYMFGQLYPCWALIMIEGNRAGNRMRAIYFTTALGVAFQLIGGAVMIPAWLMLHLISSPTANKPTEDATAIATQTLAATPWSLLIGVIVPTLLACLPTTYLGSFETKINIILFWQLFPVWTNLLQTLFAYLAPQAQRVSKIESLRLFYIPVVAFGAGTHISALTLAASAWLFPTMYNPEVGPQLTRALFAFPPHPFSGARITSAGEGAFWFIQYDAIVCSWAFLIWSTTLRAAVWEKATSTEWANRFGSILLNVVLMGPVTASTLLVWERDTVVLGSEDRAALAERKKRA